MEYYFSDTNLQRDKFLRAQIAQAADKYIPVSTFSNFNKLNELKATEALIIAACRTSDHITVNEAGTHIKPTKELPPLKQDVVQCTIYAERFPAVSTKDALRAMFQEYGAVVSISIPAVVKQQASIPFTCFHCLWCSTRQ